MRGLRAKECCLNIEIIQPFYFSRTWLPLSYVSRWALYVWREISCRWNVLKIYSGGNDENYLFCVSSSYKRFSKNELSSYNREICALFYTYDFVVIPWHGAISQKTMQCILLLFLDTARSPRRQCNAFCCYSMTRCDLPEDNAMHFFDPAW
jgi:hypothetical protein